ncbi:PIN domain nuclease [Nocardiopsis sp. CC223A]|uniref:PIN domain nuclease n=1 Tax=Nocardiopsis sp. CC223A TaxID=3044051 RepID=UPI00278C691A|nr:PIN domain nuclease [Nocardiopsis sp. CC223A]
MSLALYLADTSALARIYSAPKKHEEWNRALSLGIVAVCPITELEFLYSARSTRDRERMVDALNRMLLPVDLEGHHFTRAWEVQRLLTARGEHRSAGSVDLLVAACAETNGLTLLHHDNDFETIARVTGQTTRRV